MTVSVPSILTDRLELVSLSPSFIEALLAGRRLEAARILGSPLPEEWPGDILFMLQRRLQQLRADPSEQPWLARAMIRRTPPDGTVVGTLGFHARPDRRGVVEVGYGVLAPFRRQGYAEEAVRALFDWATREHAVRRFRASVGPSNQPSLALVRKLEFVQTGDQWDEIDGRELVFELERE